MGKITYILSKFDSNQAKSGALVVGVKPHNLPTEGDDTIANVKLDGDTWIKNPDFLGAGVAKEKNSSFVLTVESIDYSFDSLGYGRDHISEEWVLMMGKVTSTVISTGNTTTSTTNSVTTRSSSGDEVEVKDEESTVTIDYLNPRDQFAIQALRGILSHTDDPSSMSAGLMATYCESAYQWADQMMTVCAGARSKLIDGTATDDNKAVEVGSLENNTEKLLNNIIAALEKTDSMCSGEKPAYWHKEKQKNVVGDHTDEVAKTLPNDLGQYTYNTVIDAEGDHWEWTPASSSTVYAERISNPELNKRWDDYVSHSETPEGGGEAVTTKYGLYHLIKAIQDISAGGGGTTEVDFTSLIAALQGLSTDRSIIALPNVNIGDTGLGRDANNPIYISGGGFPSRQVLASAFAEAAIHDFLTFNVAGAVGYSTKEEAAKAIWSEILAEDIWSKIQIIVNNRIRAWLQAATVTINGTTYNLNVNTPT